MGQGPGLAVVQLSIAEAGRIAGSSIKYWARKGLDEVYFSWQRRPRSGRTVDISDADAHVWACSSSGRPSGEIPIRHEYDSELLDATSDQFYLWDEGGQPMVLLVLPPSTVLKDARPEPSGVWEAKNRICAFWQAPDNERAIAFQLANSNGSLKQNVQYWQDRINVKQNGPATHPILTVGSLIASAVIAAVVLIFVFDQATAAAWVAAVAAVLSLAAPVALPRTRRRPKAFKSHALP